MFMCCMFVPTLRASGKIHKASHTHSACQTTPPKLNTLVQRRENLSAFESSPLIPPSPRCHFYAITFAAWARAQYVRVKLISILMQPLV